MGNVCSISVSADGIVSETGNCISRHVSYIGALAPRIEGLRAALQDLEAGRSDVLRRVAIAEQGGYMARLKRIDVWLSIVDSRVIEARNLIEAAMEEEEKKKFLSIGCPQNCVSTYKLGKKIAKQTEEIVTALKGAPFDGMVTAMRGAPFDGIAERLPLAPANLRPIEPLVGMKPSFEDIWRCLTNYGVGIIGLYGMGGVGKTALLTKINNAIASSIHGFDFVIWVSISRSQSLAKFQEDFGRKIGLDVEEWASRSIDEKSEVIFKTLDGKKFVLLLDNLWERLDLLRAGVPLPNNQNCSKIVFTTRSEIICGCMEANKRLKLKCLDSESAWELFRKKIGDDTLNSHPDIPRLASIVAKKCAGLPLALITVGRSLACKRTPQEWSHAMRTLQKSASEFSSMGDDVLQLLKVSYDSLPNDAIRSCLLYTCLLPDDYKIDKRNLISDWFRGGLLGYDHDTIKEIENYGYDILGTLLNMCLLEEETEDERYVTVHSVIHDMILWVAQECGEEKDKYWVESGFGLTRIPKVEKWIGVRVMSLMNNNIKEIAEAAPTCPYLVALYLCNNRITVINRGFFQFMPVLRVLDLSNNEALEAFPLEVCNLLSLECLNLANTSVSELPFELKRLHKLRTLDLNYVTKLEMIPVTVISGLSALQDLGMARCGASSDRIVQGSVLSGGNEILIEELACLKHLIAVDLTIRSTNAFEKFLSSEMVMCCTRVLSFETLKDATSINLSFLEVTVHIQCFIVIDCKYLEGFRIIEDDVTEGIIDNRYFRLGDIPCFSMLLSIVIVDCPAIKDLTALVVFAPNLERLEIQRCDRMEAVFRIGTDPGEAEFIKVECLFAKLKEIHLINLQALNTICNVVLSLPRLNQVTILKCPKLNMTRVNLDKTVVSKIKIITEESWWYNVQWDDVATTQSAFVPQFLS